jgi:hypothetical protein
MEKRSNKAPWCRWGCDAEKHSGTVVLIQRPRAAPRALGSADPNSTVHTQPPLTLDFTRALPPGLQGPRWTHRNCESLQGRILTFLIFWLTTWHSTVFTGNVYWLMNIKIMINKMLSNWTHDTFLKLYSHQAGFIMGMQGWLNVRKSLIIICNIWQIFIDLRRKILWPSP